MRQVGSRLALSILAAVFLILPGSHVAAEPEGGGEKPHPKAENPADQVVIENVEVRLSDHGPVILLSAENRIIPIFVDPTVAGSIQSALTGRKMRRPLSHDLMHTILEGFGGKVTKTVITLKDGIYYAALSITMASGSKVFDSRSSDAIALAVHFKAPIIVGRELLESAGKEPFKEKPQIL
ncbi:MAG: bifunctional nuclease family protein [Nitrospirales bacterium]